MRAGSSVSRPGYDIQMLNDPVNMKGVVAPLTDRISESEFGLLRKLVYDRFGISLGEHKKTLVVGRLQKLLAAKGFETFRMYYDYLINDRSGKALNDLINRISTNYTYFYRESAHFEFFSNTVLPWIVRYQTSKSEKDVRVWTAGCSTGEEPYTLVMLMQEFLGLQYGDWSRGLLATDISENALSKARKGDYETEKITRLPGSLRKYFSRSGKDIVSIVPKVKSDITIRRFNLMNDFPFKKPFHVIFCRNVMIYFDKETRNRLVEKYYRFLEPGGYLFIGHSESIGRDQQMFDYVMPACYRKKM